MDKLNPDNLSSGRKTKINVDFIACKKRMHTPVSVLQAELKRTELREYFMERREHDYAISTQFSVEN